MITDISKGAMKVKSANIERITRYQNWKDHLNEELNFFHEPQLISIGKNPKDYLESISFICSRSIMHFSNRNRERFLQRQNQHLPNAGLDKIHETLYEFAKELLTKMNYDHALKHYILKKNFKKKLSDWKKCLFLDYKESFRLIRKDAE